MRQIFSTELFDEYFCTEEYFWFSRGNHYRFGPTNFFGAKQTNNNKNRNHFVLETRREGRHEPDGRAVRVVPLDEDLGVLRPLGLGGRVALGRPYGRRRHRRRSGVPAAPRENSRGNESTSAVERRSTLPDRSRPSGLLLLRRVGRRVRFSGQTARRWRRCAFGPFGESLRTRNRIGQEHSERSPRRSAPSPVTRWPPENGFRGLETRRQIWFASTECGLRSCDEWR